MNTDGGLYLLLTRIAEIDKRTLRIREGEKRWAFWLKMLAISLGAAITVLLGVKVDAVWSDILRNVALILGASITVVNAIDAFYDYRGLWIRRTVLHERLANLARDIELYPFVAKQDDARQDALLAFEQRLNAILEEDLQSWLKLRDSKLSDARAITSADAKADVQPRTVAVTPIPTPTRPPT